MGGAVTAPPIGTVTPNPALDVTYEVPQLIPGGELRVADVRERAGGKGFNVAGVLACLGEQVAVTGPLGGATGERLRAGIAAHGFSDRCVSIAAETRRTVAVVDRAAGQTTVLNEPGPPVAPAEWERLLEAVRILAGEVSVLTISGSLPGGVEPSAYAGLVAAAEAAGVPVLVDTSGPALVRVCAAGPTLVKPNAGELAAAVPEASGPVDAARRLLSRGAGAVALSRGADGLVLVTEAFAVQARLSRPVHGNPAGAGDAVVAAFARALATGGAGVLGDVEAAARACAEAVAVSAAAVRAPVAGQVDPADVAELGPLVRVDPLRDDTMSAHEEK